MSRVQWRDCGNFDTLGAAGCDGDGGFFRRARARQERAAWEGRMAEKNCREHALQSARYGGASWRRAVASAASAGFRHFENYRLRVRVLCC